MTITVKFQYRGYDIALIGDTAAEAAIEIALIRAEFARLDVNEPPVPAQSYTPISEDKKGAAATPEYIKVTAISREKMKSGKGEYFKVCGGQYTAYGIPLYEDACDFRDDLSPLNLLRRVPDGLQAKIEVVGGSRKITGIRVFKPE